MGAGGQQRKPSHTAGQQGQHPGDCGYFIGHGHIHRDDQEASRENHPILLDSKDSILGIVQIMVVMVVMVMVA